MTFGATGSRFGGTGRPVTAEAETGGPAAIPVEAATTTEPAFRRSRRLLLAVVGLGHGPLVMTAGLAVVPIMGMGDSHAEISMICELIALIYAVFVAWLVFAVLYPDEDVAVLPRRWLALGPWFAAYCVVQELLTIFNVWRSPSAQYSASQWWMTTFTEFGDLRLNWLVAVVFTAAFAEEIVYRALLLPALEGYMNSTRALVVHAVIFELVHAFVYGMGFSGVPFIGGLVLGWAFQRTRSLAHVRLAKRSTREER